LDKKGEVKNNISFNYYKNCLFNIKEQRRTMNIIRSRQHEIFTETVNKIALSANDDKRIILPDRINTHAWGYLSKKYKYSWSQRDINMGVKYYFPLTPRTCRGQRGGPRTYIMTLL